MLLKYNPKCIKDTMRRKSIEVDDLIVALEDFMPKVSRTLVFGWLGGSCPSAMNLYAICKVLGVKQGDFFVKASKKEEKEFLKKKEKRNKRRRGGVRKFEESAASDINSIVEKLDDLTSVLKEAKKSKSTATRKKKGKK